MTKRIFNYSQITDAQVAFDQMLDQMKELAKEQLPNLIVGFDDDMFRRMLDKVMQRGPEHMTPVYFKNKEGICYWEYHGPGDYLAYYHRMSKAGTDLIDMCRQISRGVEADIEKEKCAALEQQMAPLVKQMNVEIETQFPDCNLAVCAHTETTFSISKSSGQLLFSDIPQTEILPVVGKIHTLNVLYQQAIAQQNELFSYVSEIQAAD